VADAELIAKNVPAATAKASFGKLHIDSFSFILSNVIIRSTNGDVPGAAMRASMLVEYAGFY
jgi:hypothetical protein